MSRNHELAEICVAYRIQIQQVAGQHHYQNAYQVSKHGSMHETTIRVS